MRKTKKSWKALPWVFALLTLGIGFFLGRNTVPDGAQAQLEIPVETETVVVEPATEAPIVAVDLAEMPQLNDKVTEALEPSVDESIEHSTEERAVKPTEETTEEVILVNINVADAQELETISGIGSTLAQRIVDYRIEHGDFASVDELIEVSGIGATSLEKMRLSMTVE